MIAVIVGDHAPDDYYDDVVHSWKKLKCLKLKAKGPYKNGKL